MATTGVHGHWQRGALVCVPHVHIDDRVAGALDGVYVLTWRCIAAD